MGICFAATPACGADGVWKLVDVLDLLLGDQLDSPLDLSTYVMVSVERVYTLIFVRLTCAMVLDASQALSGSEKRGADQPCVRLWQLFIVRLFDVRRATGSSELGGRSQEIIAAIWGGCGWRATSWKALGGCKNVSLIVSDGEKPRMG